MKPDAEYACQQGSEFEGSDNPWSQMADCNNCASGYIQAALWNIVNEGWCNVCGEAEDGEDDFPFGHESDCWVAGAVKWQKEWENRGAEPVCSQMTGQMRMGLPAKPVKVQGKRKKKPSPKQVPENKKVA